LIKAILAKKEVSLRCKKEKLYLRELNYENQAELIS